MRTEQEATAVPEAMQIDAAYRAIRRAILCCDLAPGDYVSEAKLAAAFGFGRAAVRAALIRLDHERLVQAVRRRGYIVSAITFKSVQDLFGLRLIIEPAAARLAATRADSGLISELRRLNERCDPASADSDLNLLREANKTFHLTVARASGNERLASLCEQTMDELDRVLYLRQVGLMLERAGASVEEHQRIIDALAARNADLAEQVAREHILPNQRAVIDALIASPGLQAINLADV